MDNYIQLIHHPITKLGNFPSPLPADQTSETVVLVLFMKQIFVTMLTCAVRQLKSFNFNNIQSACQIKLLSQWQVIKTVWTHSESGVIIDLLNIFSHAMNLVLQRSISQLHFRKLRHSHFKAWWWQYSHTIRKTSSYQFRQNSTPIYFINVIKSHALRCKRVSEFVFRLITVYMQ